MYFGYKNQRGELLQKEGNYYKMRLKEIFNYQRPAESRQLTCALTFCGGFVDAYTYIQRGIYAFCRTNWKHHIL